MVNQIEQLTRPPACPRPHPACPDGESDCPANPSGETFFTHVTSTRGSGLLALISLASQSRVAARQARWGLSNLPPQRNRNRSTSKHKISPKLHKLNTPGLALSGNAVKDFRSRIRENSDDFRAFRILTNSATIRSHAFFRVKKSFTALPLRAHRVSRVFSVPSKGSDPFSDRA
jgi:hypothetical protein